MDHIHLVPKYFLLFINRGISTYVLACAIWLVLADCFAFKAIFPFCYSTLLNMSILILISHILYTHTYIYIYLIQLLLFLSQTKKCTCTPLRRLVCQGRRTQRNTHSRSPINVLTVTYMQYARLPS